MRLGKARPNGNGVQWRKTVNGRMWTSKTYPTASRDNKRDATLQFMEWQDGIPSKRQEARLTKIQLLERELTELRRQLAGTPRIGSNHDFIEQTEGEIEEGEAELNLRRNADQRGFDVDERTNTKREIAALFSGNDMPPDIENYLYNSDLLGEAISNDKTIGYWFSRFIDRERINRNVSPTTWSEITSMTKCFVDWMGEATPVESINETKVEDYFLYLSTQGSKIKKRTRMIAFVKYLALQRLIPLPLNLDSIKFQTNETEIKHFDPIELGNLLVKSDGFLKCSLYLMANCGMTQRDVATLTPAMYQDGFIVRKRSKKAKLKGATETKWKLWPETIKLIEQYRTDENGLLFTTGGRTWYLLETTTDSEGNEKLSKDDKISGLWRDFKMLYSPTLSMRYIRKTSSHYLPTDNESMKDMFLNHQPEKMGLKHYYSIDQNKFDEAVMGLRSVYGMK